MYLLKVRISYSSGTILSQFTSILLPYIGLFLSEFARRYVSTTEKKKKKEEAVIYNPHCLLRRIDPNNLKFHCLLGVQWVK